MTTAEHITKARHEAARRAEVFAQRKNDEAIARIVERGGPVPITDWKAIANQLRKDGKI